MCENHPLANRAEIDFHDLLDEPFLALPASAGELRDYWLALDHRGGHPVRIGAEVRNADEAFEALANQAGVVLLSAGNARLYRRPAVVARPVRGLNPSQLAIAWRAYDVRAQVNHFTDACLSAATDLRPRDHPHGTN